MRALQVSGPDAFEIIDLRDPEPSEGEVVIRIGACTICNQHDSRVFAGPHSTYPLEPGFPGHEAAGEVVAVGPGVKEVAVGDRVVTSGIGGPPLYRELVTRQEKAVATYRSETPFAEAAPLELFGCVHRAVLKASSVRGMRTAVVGLGPAGLACCQLLAAYGAAEVIALDLREERLDPALESGATETVLATRYQPAPEMIAKRMRGESSTPEEKALAKELESGLAPLVFECSGSARSLETSFLLAGQELIVFGYTTDPVTAWQPVWFARELTIKNSKILSLDDLRAVAELMDRGRIAPGKLISARMAFSQYDKAIAAVRGGEAIKVALVWD